VLCDEVRSPSVFQYADNHMTDRKDDHYIQVHCLPVRKRQGKLLKKQVRILGTGSVFEYNKEVICKL
jgi:hypothetical protein